DSPAAQKLMDENDIAAADVKGTGKDNRITKADVVAVIDQHQGSAQATAPTPSAEPAASTEPAAPAQTAAPGTEKHEYEQAERQALARAPQERLEQRVPMTRI